MNTSTNSSGPALGSRFEGWPQKACWALLALTLSVIVLGLVETPTPVADTHAVSVQKTDNGLYLAVIDRVEKGENYYTAVVDEQGQRGYPLRPSVAVREPTLTYIGALLRTPIAMRVFLGLLALVASIFMVATTEGLSRNRASWWASILLFASAIAAAFSPHLFVIHEVWAMVLMLLALFASGARKPRLAAALGLLAVLIRELAFPFLIVMAILAWREKRKSEVRAWIVSIVVFACAFATHTALVLSHTNSHQLHAPGWVKLGGWSFILETVRSSCVLLTMPVAVSAIVVPLALLGWLSKRGEFADRVLLLMAMYIPLFMVLGRPWNSYWGLLYTAMLIPGLAFSPAAIWELCRRLRTQR